eukprot:12171793-Alexandrium_andersonii.AAC.1
MCIRDRADDRAPAPPRCVGVLPGAALHGSSPATAERTAGASGAALAQRDGRLLRGAAGGGLGLLRLQE